jgi:hypothetical protein
MNERRSQVVQQLCDDLNPVTKSHLTIARIEVAKRHQTSLKILCHQVLFKDRVAISGGDCTLFLEAFFGITPLLESLC